MEKRGRKAKQIGERYIDTHTKKNFAIPNEHADFLNYLKVTEKVPHTLCLTNYIENDERFIKWKKQKETTL